MALTVRRSATASVRSTSHSAAQREPVQGEIVVVEPTGAETEFVIQAGGMQLTLVTSGRPAVTPGQRVGLAIDPAMVHLFDRATGARL